MSVDPPEITGEQSYIQDGLEGIKLELVCIVHASPKANVSWYKNGQLVNTYLESFIREYIFFKLEFSYFVTNCVIFNQL